MSHTTSALLGRGQSVVAIAGATGKLGQAVTKIFLSTSFRHFFSRVLVLTRDTSTSSSKSLADLGAELHQASLDAEDPASKESLKEALKGVDVLINVLGSTYGKQHDNLVETAIAADVKVYFPSEFGADHRVNNFPGFDHKAWKAKQDHASNARRMAEERVKDSSKERLKIISVYTGLLLEASFGPWFGFDIANGTFTACGSSSSLVAYTSKDDIGRALAQLSILSMASSTAVADTVPEYVRIAGSFRSVDQVKVLVERVSGKSVKIETLDLDKERSILKEDSFSGKAKFPAEHIRILMGEGKMDFSADNHDELVNPKEKLWKWKTVDDFIEETNGKGSV